MSSSWITSADFAIRAISLARETGTLLVRDESQTLSLIDPRGSLQARLKFAGLAAASASDDGSALAAVGSAGQRWWLGPGLQAPWGGAVSAPRLGLAAE